MRKSLAAQLGCDEPRLEEALEKVLSDRDYYRTKCREIGNAADEVGWDGIENPKILSEFVRWLGEDRDRYRRQAEEAGQVVRRVKCFVRDRQKLLDPFWDDLDSQLERAEQKERNS
jgi:hypothetical protein